MRLIKVIPAILLVVLVVGPPPLLLVQGQLTSSLTYARVDSLRDALVYLFKFGYIKDLQEALSVINPTSFISGIDIRSPAASGVRLAFTKFQEYARLPVTGEFDEGTKKKMNTPRCGNKDIIQIGVPLRVNQLLRKRRKRFVTGAFEWEKLTLTYQITQFSESGYPKDQTLKDVERAVGMWGTVSNLEFKRVQEGVDIEVDVEMRFARLVHGDIEPFDGRGITLAHAFPPGPEVGGDVHFDDDEDWTAGTSEGTNFLYVVVHELGHALGLRHSDEEDAIMYAFAPPYNPNMELHEDDVLGIQELYGAPGQSVGGSSRPENPEGQGTTLSLTSTTTGTEDPGPSGDKTPPPDLCKEPKLDAITTLDDGSVYAFKGNYAYKLDPDGKGILDKSTDLISYVFYGLEGNIDAALTYEGKTYFFKGDRYWRYVNRKLDGQDFPRLISVDFPGIPNDLDAALTWSGDNTLYFFKGHLYWNFDPKRKPHISKIYPFEITQWYGLPSKDLDAAFTAPDSGPTYFFKDDKYWLFNTEDFMVPETTPPYPRASRVMWFGCTEFQPEPADMRRGFVGDAIDAVKDVFKGVASHVDYKFKKIKGWLG